MADQVPPSGITERSRPQEQPTFRVLRRKGACSLWRSQTAEQQVLDYTRPPRIHYHVSPMVRALSVFALFNCVVCGVVLWLLDDNFWRLAFVGFGTPMIWSGARQVLITVRRFAGPPSAEGNHG